jgi:hypothetical protein
MKTEKPTIEFISDDLADTENLFNILFENPKGRLFYFFRLVWAFRTLGGSWWQVAMFISLQLFLTLPSVLLDLFLFASEKLLVLLWSLISYFLRPIMIVLGAGLGLFLLYFFIKSGQWRNLYDYLIQLF